MRFLFLAHRYLGIGIGLMMLVWCLSGVVMMYVPYPSLPEPDRLRALPPIDWQRCCALPNADALAADVTVEKLQLEMLGDTPVLRLGLAGGRRMLVDLVAGRALDTIDAKAAGSVAQAFGTAAGLGAPARQRMVERDQWTVSGSFNRDRPLYLFAWDDPAGSELYVSSHSGWAVQTTDTAGRFWNWFGAVPHWLYFTPLRSNPGLWTQCVIWLSLLGCFLTATGLFIGVRQFLRRPAARWSPYRGLNFWHHLPGLVFGLFVLSWIASGLVSMNPWGFLDSEGAAAEEGRLQGPPPRWGDIAASLPRLGMSLDGAVSVSLARLDGKLFFLADYPNGERRRFAADGTAALLTPAEQGFIAGALGVPPGALLTAEDTYYFSHHRDIVPLPVYRFIAGGTRYYVDPVSGSLVAKIDADGQWYRWLHQGLHRLDLLPALRARPVWDVTMLALLAGVTAVCATGTWLGIRRLRR